MTTWFSPTRTARPHFGRKSGCGRTQSLDWVIGAEVQEPDPFVQGDAWGVLPETHHRATARGDQRTRQFTVVIGVQPSGEPTTVKHLNFVQSKTNFHPLNPMST